MEAGLSVSAFFCFRAYSVFTNTYSWEMIMSESEDSYKEKDVAFYSATLSAWYTTKFEKDKHLLSLSAAGIGLLVTLATAVGVANYYTAIVYVLAVVSFLVCILAVISIFGRNADHLERLVAGADEQDNVLSILDGVASASFVIGIVFTLFVGLFSGIDNFSKQECIMSDNSNKMVDTSSNRESRSVNGATNLRPSKPQSNPSDGQSQPSSTSTDKK